MTSLPIMNFELIKKENGFSSLFSTDKLEQTINFIFYKIFNRSLNRNQVITGKVKDNKQFGTLVYLDAETIGLIHISELEKIGKTLQEGQTVKVKVIAIERTIRKIYLSIA